MSTRLASARQKKPLPPLLPGVEASGWCRVHPVYWLPAMIVFALAMLVPENLLERSLGLNTFCTLMIGWFPFLGKHAAVSSIPGATTVVKCVSFALTPLFAMLPFMFVWKDRGVALQRRIETGTPPPWWLELNVVAILLLEIAGIWVLAGDPLSCPGCTTKSTFGLALTSSMALFGFSFIPITLATSIYIRLGFWLGIKESGDE
jgi:hypothetical protein